MQDLFAVHAVSEREGLAYSCRTPSLKGKDVIMTHHYSATDYNRLMDAAKARALQLRSEAVEDFWNETSHAAGRALRAANRLAHSLARHARLRQQQGA